jgi:hypothetical protein
MASDLNNTTAVRAFFARQHIDVVVLARRGPRGSTGGAPHRLTN